MKKKPFKPEAYADAKYYDNLRVSSATECTGIAPAAVNSEDEAEAIAELYAVNPVKPDKKV